jgi:hypothetical protein
MFPATRVLYDEPFSSQVLFSTIHFSVPNLAVINLFCWLPLRRSMVWWAFQLTGSILRLHRKLCSVATLSWRNMVQTIAILENGDHGGLNFWGLQYAFKYAISLFMYYRCSINLKVYSGPCKCKCLLTFLLRASGGRPVGNVAGPSPWRENRGWDERCKVEDEG